MLVGPELVINGDFADWVDDDPTSVPAGWIVHNEDTGDNDPEVSEVGADEGHGGVGTGFCNLYSSNDVRAYMIQDITLVVGIKYRFSVNVNTITAGLGLTVLEMAHTTWPTKLLKNIGESTFTFVATYTDIILRIQSSYKVDGTDVTIDDVSVRADIPTELSRTGHRFSSFPEN